MGVVEATYAEIKQQELKKNPYSCLLTAAIDVNPHQVEAFTFSLAAMKLGGAVLADEVGLGKTIEADLVLKYLLNSGSQKILLVMPSNLRKQWQVELDEKFEVESLIVESGNWDEYKSYVKNESAVVIVSYNFALRRKSEFAKVPWSFCVFDEAHRLRNVYKNGSKMASNLYELTKGIPKLMLTATPMQNSLFDLYGLIQFIDKRIFYSKAVFSDRYIKNEQYEDLRHQVSTVLQRTLRKEVSDYIQFPERKEMTVDFELSLPEVELYMKINNYLKKEILFALPNSHRALITSVIRKLLASSSMAVAETFRTLKNRLVILKETTREESVEERFFKERGIKFQFIDMKEKGMSKGEFNSVAQANGGLENMINWEGKDKDLLALIKYIAEEDKLEKVLENPQVIKTPVVRNGKQSTLGYQPDIWKAWK